MREHCQQVVMAFSLVWLLKQSTFPFSLSLQYNAILQFIQYFLSLSYSKRAFDQIQLNPFSRQMSQCNESLKTHLKMQQSSKLYQFYLLSLPTMRTLSSFLVTPQFASPKHRKPSQYQFFNNQYKKRRASLMDMYSIRIKQITHKEVPQSSKRHKSQQHQKCSKDTIIINNNGLYHVGKTIDSINDYAEQLKLTLLKQYKAHKMRTIRNKRTKNGEEPLTYTQIQGIQELIEVKEDKTSKETTKDHAYKTLNLLYQTIIDNSFRHRDKDEFQLQAVRLPIVDRFNNRNQTIKMERQLQFKCKNQHIKRTERSLPHVKTDTHPPLNKKQVEKTQPLLLDEGIVPWATNELD